MSDPIAALPMYDWPEERAATDSAWARLRDHLRGVGVDAPDRLARRNADLTAVPGGIRDAAGRVVAPDPATLPPDSLDLPTLWRHPALLLAQACWGPLETSGLGEVVIVVGQPFYDGIEGGQGIFYSSALLMRRDAVPASATLGGASFEACPKGEVLRMRAVDAGAGGPHPEVPARTTMGGPERPEADEPRRTQDDGGKASLLLDLLRGQRLAFNSPDSMSGIIGLRRDLEAMGADLRIFAGLIETGAHRASIVAVAEGRADVCAVDARTWALAKRHERCAAGLVVIGWTAMRKGLPYVTSRHTPPKVVDVLRRLVEEAGLASVG